MRLRKKAYEASAKYRGDMNGKAIREPESLEALGVAT